MKQKFIVIESNQDSFKNEIFEIKFILKTNIKLPFTKYEYRCIMFDGIKLKLINGDNYIIGSLM